MRDAMAEMGGDPKAINPLQPVELVVDHSVQVDYFGSDAALAKNADLEFERNHERYAFLKWGQSAFAVSAPCRPTPASCTKSTSSISRASSSAWRMRRSEPLAYPDTAVGTDSHTTMVNGLGVLAWGVGGIEAEAAMLGQPVTMLIPEVVGVRLDGALREGVTATDLVLTITEMLRKNGVVGKFVEFFGRGLSALPVADRTTIGNMSPEFGSTVAIFPIDDRTLEYLRLTGRAPDAHRAGRSVREGARVVPHRRDARSGVQRRAGTRSLDRRAEPRRTAPSAGSRRAARRQGDVRRGDGRVDRAARAAATTRSRASRAKAAAERRRSRRPTNDVSDGAVVIAAITSCTNTSNPVRADRRGFARAQRRAARPEDAAVGENVARAGIESRHRLSRKGGTAGVPRCARIQPRRLRLHDVHRKLRAASARRRRDGRRPALDRRGGALRQPQLRRAHPSAGACELPRLAAAGRRVRADREDGRRPHDRAARNRQRRLSRSISRTSGRATTRSTDASRAASTTRCSKPVTPTCSAATTTGRSSRSTPSERYAWDPQSEYVKKPPYFDGMPAQPAPLADIAGARALAVLGDSVTTDHISPAGTLRATAPAGEVSHGARHRAEGFQFLRLAARQSRGDGARNVCQRAAA